MLIYNDLAGLNIDQIGENNEGGGKKLKNFNYKMELLIILFWYAHFYYLFI